MGRHARPPTPPDSVDPDDPLAPYQRRRQPPMEGPRRHRPLHGGGSHREPETPRVLEAWDGFTYRPVGTAPDLAAARDWLDNDT